MDDTTNNFNGFRVFNNKIKKFENIKDFEINQIKTDLLNKLVEFEENKVNSKIHHLYSFYISEWNLTPKIDLLKAVYRKMLKMNPKEFLQFSSPSSFVILEGKMDLVKNNIIDYFRISIDYNCMRNLSFILLNCIHYLKRKKKSISNFLNKDYYNQFPDSIRSFFVELESVKSIKIIFFEEFIDALDLSNQCSCNNTKKHEKDCLKVSDMHSKTVSFSEKRNSSNNITLDTYYVNHNHVYFFFQFIKYLFPNLLEIDLIINMDHILDKHRHIDGMFIDSRAVYKKYETYFLSILLSTYFISKCENVQTLRLNVDDSLKLETLFLINSSILSSNLKSDLNWKNFTIFDNFYRNNNYFFLDLKFNCIDSLLFEKINNIIFQNIGVRSLKLTLFLDWDSSNFNKLKLKKLAKMNTINKEKAFFDKKRTLSKEFIQNLTSDAEFPTISKKHSNQIIYFNDSLLDEELYSLDWTKEFDNVFDSFIENLKVLFIIIESKTNIINHLTLNVNPPVKMLEQNSFVFALMGFIYNILKIVAKENSEISSLEINSENIPFDYKLLGLLDDKKNRIDLRKTTIENLNLNMKVISNLNFLKFIPESVICLKLSGLNFETFSLFVEKLNKNFNKLRNLVELTLNIILSTRNTDKLIQILKDFFKLNKPFNIETLNFTINYVLKDQDIRDILKIIENIDNKYNYHDRIKSYYLNFTTPLEDQLNKRIIKLDHKYESKIINLVSCIKRCSKTSKMYHHKSILKQISLLIFSYSKIVVLT